MASGTTTPKSAGPEKKPGTDRYEDFIETRLLDTQRQVKGVDIADGLITLAIGILAYLLVAAVIDHWLVSGGLGFWSRFFLLLGLLGGAGYYFYLRVVPPLIRRINPVFAARTIEEGEPSLKNSLINFLLMRSHREKMPKVIYHALQQRAATDLSTVEVDSSVDRRHVMRLAYVLIATLVLFCLYLALSPKSPLTSAIRVIWPWAAIDAPTRVTIMKVKPGDTTAYHGEQIVVSAEVKGLRAEEPIRLIYNTADRQTIDQAIPMAQPDGRLRYECKLPPGNIGFEQDYEYYLVAGDYRTETFNIKVQIAPTITVDRVEYDYPAYTGLARSVDERQGDIRAIEGTKVTLHAGANKEIKRAEIDLGCDGVHELMMQTDGDRAQGSFELEFDPEIPSRPAYDCYQLRFTDTRGLTNRRPTRYRIEVIPDLPPGVSVIEPDKDEIQVPSDGRQTIRLRAEDPDFALSSVHLRVENKKGQLLPIKPLLDRVHQGEFIGEYAFEPQRLGLRAGDRVCYWGEARDNKSPEPNRTKSPSRWILVIGPELVEPPPLPPNDPRHDPRRGMQQPEGKRQVEQSAGQEPEAEQQDPAKPSEPNQQQAPEQQPDAEQPGERQPGEQAQEGAGDSRADQQAGDQQKNEAIDSRTQQADAIDQILKDREEQQQQDSKQQGEQGGAQGSKQGAQQQNEQQNEQQQGEQQTGQQQSGEQSGQKQTGQQQEARQQEGQQQSGEQSGQKQGQQKTGEQEGQKGGQQEEGQQQGGEQPGGQKQQQGGQQPGKQQGGQQEGGQQEGGKQQGGQQEGGQEGGQQQAGKQQGAEQPGEQKPGGEQQGGQQQGGKQPGGQEKPGEQQGGQQQGSKPQGGGQRESDQKGQQQGGQKQQEQKQTGEKEGGGQQGAHQQGEKKQQGGEKGGKQQGGGQQENKQQAGEQKGAQQQGGQQQKGEKKKGGKSEGSPGAQGGNKPKKEKKDGESGKSGEGKSKKEKSKGKSPSGSEQQSEGKGQTSGDQSGEGQEGGGQKSPKPGKGAAGASTDAERGGAPSNNQGEGETGQRAGDQVETDRETGSSKQESDSEGAGKQRNRSGSSGEGRRPSKEEGPKGGQPMDDPPDGGQAGNQASDGPGALGRGNTETHGGDNAQQRRIPPKDSEAAAADKANLEYNKKATELALEHLRDQMKQPDSKLLKRLGWTPEETRKFQERIDKLIHPEQPSDESLRRRNDFLRSLDIRPHGTQLRGGNTGATHTRKREATRHEAPGAWKQWMEAYSRSIANGGR